MQQERTQVRVKWTRCYKDQVTSQDLLKLLRPLVTKEGENQEIVTAWGSLPDCIIQMILEFLPTEPFNSAYEPYPYRSPELLHMSSSFDFRVKLLLQGDLGVGKTSLRHRFTNSPWNASTHIIMCDISYHALLIGDKLVNVIVNDNVASARFRSEMLSISNATTGVIYVFDLAKDKSFLNLKKAMTNSENKQLTTRVHKFVIGNKSDLLQDCCELYREEIKNRAIYLSDQLEIPFFQVSAKTGQNVHLAFSSFVRDIVRDLKQPSEIQRQPSEGGIVIDRLEKRGSVCYV